MSMRIKIFFALCVGALAFGSAFGQHYVGAKVGYGSGSVRLFPQQETGMIWGMYSGGLSWKYYSTEKYVGGVQVDLEFMQKGYKHLKPYAPMPEDTTTMYYRYVNSVQLPLIWQPHVYLFNRSLRVFLNLGLVFSYNIDSHYKWTSDQEGLIEEGTYDMILVRDNRWGYGLCGGFGMSVLMNRFEIMAEGRYYYGYSDILKNRNKYADNPLRSPLDNINISIGMYYRLGKGGLLSAPSKRAAARMLKKESKELEKNEK